MGVTIVQPYRFILTAKQLYESMYLLVFFFPWVKCPPTSGVIQRLSSLNSGGRDQAYTLVDPSTFWYLMNNWRYGDFNSAYFRVQERIIKKSLPSFHTQCFLSSFNSCDSQTFSVSFYYSSYGHLLSSFFFFFVSE